MTPLYRFLLKHIAKQLVKQGYSHRKNITEYYQILHEAAAAEFTEDHTTVLRAFLNDRAADASENIRKEKLKSN